MSNEFRPDVPANMEQTWYDCTFLKIISAEATPDDPDLITERQINAVAAELSDRANRADDFLTGLG